MFDEFVRTLMKGEDEQAPKPPRKIESKAIPPASGLLYDYVFEANTSTGKGKWVSWRETLDKSWAIPPTAQYAVPGCQAL